MKIYNEFSPAAYRQSINLELLARIITAKAMAQTRKKVERVLDRYNRLKAC